MKPLEIKGNYKGQDFGVKFVFGPLVDTGSMLEIISMIEQEFNFVFTMPYLRQEVLGEAQKLLHEALDRFLEVMEKTITEGVRW